jgi:hypothetical protein
MSFSVHHKPFYYVKVVIRLREMVFHPPSHLRWHKVMQKTGALVAQEHSMMAEGMPYRQTART